LTRRVPPVPVSLYLETFGLRCLAVSLSLFFPVSAKLNLLSPFGPHLGKDGFSSRYVDCTKGELDFRCVGDACPLPAALSWRSVDWVPWDLLELKRVVAHFLCSARKQLCPLLPY